MKNLHLPLHKVFLFALTVQEIAESTIKIFGKGKIKTIDYSDISREATLLHLNCDKANNILKWYV